MKTAGAPLERPPARQQEREPLMHEQGTPQRDDLRAESTVLEFVLSQPPGLLTTRDLLLELKDADAVERAVRDLTAAGLLRQEGASLYPTLAAVRFDQLPA
jgi:hypothetical protein